MTLRQYVDLMDPRTSNRHKQSIKPGDINRNGQVVIRNTGLPGTDHLQLIYQVGCSKCGNVYGVNGSDFFERKCPKCQKGRPGLPYE